jgi:hypothetical protein
VALEARASSVYLRGSVKGVEPIMDVTVVNLVVGRSDNVEPDRRAQLALGLSRTLDA